MALKDLFRRPFRPGLDAVAERLKANGFDKDGRFIPDPVPVAPPVGYIKQPSMVEIVRDMVRSERLRLEALESGHETFEEAEDFDIPDEPEIMNSPWENEFDPPLPELLAAGEAAERAKAGGAGAPPAPSPEPPAAPPAKPTPVPTGTDPAV